MVLFPSIADMDETSDFEPWVVILVHLPFFSLHVGLPRRLWCEAEAIRVDGLPCGQKNERIVCSEFMRFAAWLLNAAAWEITTHHRMACPFGHAKVLLFHFDWWPFEGRDNSRFLMKVASGTVHVWAWFANTCVILKCVCYHACLRKKTNQGQDVIQYLTVLLDTYGPIVLGWNCYLNCNVSFHLVHLTCDICQFSAICFGFVALHLTCFYGQELLIWVGWTCIILMQIGVLQIWMKQKQNFVHRSSAWDNWWVRDGLLWAPCGAVLRDLTMQHAVEIFGRLYIPRENNSVYG